jgi:hypothetical protein
MSGYNPDGVADLGVARRAKENKGRHDGVEITEQGEAILPKEKLTITETEALRMAEDVVAAYSDTKILLAEFNKESSDLVGLPIRSKVTPEMRLEESLKSFRFQASTASMKTLLHMFQRQQIDPNAFFKVYLFAAAEELIKRLKPAK